MLEWKCDTTVTDIADWFEIDESELDGATILMGDYTYEDYSGSGFVLFERDGKLYEAHGSHCSCYGLEGQWDPEETTIEALEHTNTQGWVFSEFRTELRELLERLKIEQSPYFGSNTVH